MDLFSRKILIFKTHELSYGVKSIITHTKKITIAANVSRLKAHLFLWLSRKPFPGFLMKYIA